MLSNNTTIMSGLRFETRKFQGIKVNAKNFKGKVIGYFEPTGYGCFDTERNEFVIFTEGSACSSYQRKYIMDDVVSQFNELGATCGNDNLKLIERYTEQ